MTLLVARSSGPSTTSRTRPPAPSALLCPVPCNERPGHSSARVTDRRGSGSRASTLLATIAEVQRCRSARGRCRTAHWQWLRKRWRRRAQRWTLRHRRCSTRSTARSKAARRQGRRCVRTADALSPPAASGFAAASAHTVAGVQLCNGRAQEMLLDVFNTDEPADGLLLRLRRWQKQQHSHH